MTPQIYIKRGFQGEMAQSLMFKILSAVICALLWFNKVSFILLKLVQ